MRRQDSVDQRIAGTSSFAEGLSPHATNELVCKFKSEVDFSQIGDERARKGMDGNECDQGKSKVHACADKSNSVSPIKRTSSVVRLAKEGKTTPRFLIE